MSLKAIANLPVTKINGSGAEDMFDALAIEEPLEIRLEYGASGDRRVQNISVTMRTPGNDAELATGFLYTEGIVTKKEDIATVEHCFIACAENKENVIQVSLNQTITPSLLNTERNFYTTSSCGVCGKGSINAIRTVNNLEQKEDKNTVITDVLYKLPDILSQHQKVFADTGGLHASALFTPEGELLLVREDVGRHNALDKLVGAAITTNLLPLNGHILLLSGRASFELVQKAVMAGINIIAAVGAPSSLAVQLAEEFNVTLVGFLRDKRFNIYTAAHRVLIPNYEASH
ncbi:MAG: formate dehydrogenase accessory sulfurtransferase FdhD [Mucilaginibacter sp.]